MFNEEMPFAIRGCESPSHVRNIIGYSFLHVCLRVQNKGKQPHCKETFIHQKHWEKISHSESLNHKRYLNLFLEGNLIRINKVRKHLGFSFLISLTREQMWR